MNRPDPAAFERGIEDGLTDRERMVLDLVDAGADRATIAQRTGLKPHRVQSIKDTFADSGRDPWKDRDRLGSMMLSDAITRMLARRQPGASA